MTNIIDLEEGNFIVYRYAKTTIAYEEGVFISEVRVKLDSSVVVRDIYTNSHLGIDEKVEIYHALISEVFSNEEEIRQIHPEYFL